MVIKMVRKEEIENRINELRGIIPAFRRNSDIRNELMKELRTLKLLRDEME